MSWNVATAPTTYDGSVAMSRSGTSWTATLGAGHIFDMNTIGPTNDQEPITITFHAVGSGGSRNGSGPTVTLINATQCIG